MATCLVTGGSGFLGSHLCDALLAQGHRVICVDNFDTGSLANIKHLRGGDFVFLHRDVTEPFFVDEPVDFVYHFASPASPIDYLRLPLHTLKVGSYGTHHALGLAKHHRARFLIASTSEVYGDPQVHHQPVNIGNPNEFTLLELAHAVIDITGSRSEIVHEALPTDDPKIRQPDITLAREILDWEPAVELREGLRRTLEASGAEALTGAGLL